MLVRNRIRFAILLVGLGTWSAITTSAQAGMTYHVIVDSSAIAPGTVGYLDLQFIPGGAAIQAASVKISNFEGTSLNLGAVDFFGDTTGSSPLPAGPIILGNSSAMNEALQLVNFGSGSGFSFDVTFDGPAVDSPDGLTSTGTTFSFWVLDELYNSLLGAPGATDPLLVIDITPITGELSTTNLSSGTVTVTPVSPVPESSSALLLAVGVLGAAGVGVRRRRRESGGLAQFISG